MLFFGFLLVPLGQRGFRFAFILFLGDSDVGEGEFLLSVRKLDLSILVNFLFESLQIGHLLRFP